MAIPLNLSEVPNLSPYVQYVAAGGQVLYPYPFPITQDSDLVVVINGVTQPTDSSYSLTGQGNDTGGNCILNTGSTAGDIITLYRDIPIQRLTQISQNSGFSSSAFNAEFNNLYLIAQQLEAQFATTLQIPNTNSGSPITLLTPAAYANKYLSFDANGNPQPAALTSSGSITGALIAGLLNLITAIAPTADRIRSASEIAAGVVPVNYAYPVGHILRYGAVLDGSTDDSTAVQHWLNVGGLLTFPVVATAKVTAALTLVSNTYIIATKGATINQTGANLNVLSANTQNAVLIEGLTLQLAGTFSSYFNGNGVHIESSTNVHVVDSVITGHRGWGVMIYNSQESSVTRTRFLNSSVNGNPGTPDNNGTVAGDISISGNSSRNIAIGNWCLSGNGIGISVHNLLITDVTDDNVVASNVIQNCVLYGAECYNGGAGSLNGNIFSNNSIRNISGIVPHVTEGYVYGTGIYTVDSTNTVINGNKIKNTHSAAVVFIDLLAPGSIGVTNCGATTVVGNHCDTDRMYGITVRNPGAAGPAQAPTTVVSNNITNITIHGIQILEKEFIKVADNYIDTTGGDGILFSNSVTQRLGNSCTGNTVKSAASHGILVQFCKGFTCSHNTVISPGISGININSNVSDVVVIGNVVYNQTSYGIYIDASTVGFTLVGNNVNANSAGSYGYWIDAHWQPNTSNRAIGWTTAEYGGTYVPWYSSPPSSGTWVQRDIVWNGGPVASNFIGWVCVASGTPGTWKTFGAIAA